MKKEKLHQRAQNVITHLEKRELWQASDALRILNEKFPGLISPKILSEYIETLRWSYVTSDTIYGITQALNGLTNSSPKPKAHIVEVKKNIPDVTRDIFEAYTNIKVRRINSAALDLRKVEEKKQIFDSEESRKARKYRQDVFESLNKTLPKDLPPKPALETGQGQTRALIKYEWSFNPTTDHKMYLKLQGRYAGQRFNVWVLGKSSSEPLTSLHEFTGALQPDVVDSEPVASRTIVAEIPENCSNLLLIVEDDESDTEESKNVSTTPPTKNVNPNQLQEYRDAKQELQQEIIDICGRIRASLEQNQFGLVAEALQELKTKYCSELSAEIPFFLEELKQGLVPPKIIKKIRKMVKYIEKWLATTEVATNITLFPTQEAMKELEDTLVQNEQRLLAAKS